MQHIIFASFTIEMIFKLMTPPISGDVSERSHLFILKKYAKSGWLFLDAIATFPFYLIQ